MVRKLNSCFTWLEKKELGFLWLDNKTRVCVVRKKNLGFYGQKKQNSGLHGQKKELGFLWLDNKTRVCVVRKKNLGFAWLENTELGFAWLEK